MRRWLIMGGIVLLVGFVLIITLRIELDVMGVQAAPQARTPRIFSSGRDTVPITYQGQLTELSTHTPVHNKECTFDFELYDAQIGGRQLGSRATVTTTVINGVFTAKLDFGTYDYAGQVPWLATQVKCGNETPTSFEERQPLTPAPYALALPGMRTQYNVLQDGGVGTDLSPNIIGGSISNLVSDTIQGGTITGGGSQTDALESNSVTADFGTVTGGLGNKVRGFAATVLGGRSNEAVGSTSLAAGLKAKAVDTGAFVWADSMDRQLTSSRANQFIVRADGGIWLGKARDKCNRFIPDPLNFDRDNLITTSIGAYLDNEGVWQRPAPCPSAILDRKAIDGRTILYQVAALPLYEWRYQHDETNRRHMGPLDTDFAALFKLGDAKQSMSAPDVEGVALAAIQGLYQLVQERDSQLTELKQEIKTVQSENLVLRTELDELQARISALETGATQPRPTHLTSLMNLGLWTLALTSVIGLCMSLWRRQETGQ